MPRLFRLRAKLLLLVAGSLLPVLLLVWVLALVLLDHVMHALTSRQPASS